MTPQRIKGIKIACNHCLRSDGAHEATRAVVGLVLELANEVERLQKRLDKEEAGG